MVTKKTVLARVPRDVDNILRAKMPKYTSETRWRFVYDNSAFKLNEWLGQSITQNAKKKKR